MLELDPTEIRKAHYSSNINEVTREILNFATTKSTKPLQANKNKKSS